MDSIHLDMQQLIEMTISCKPGFDNKAQVIIDRICEQEYKINALKWHSTLADNDDLKINPVEWKEANYPDEVFMSWVDPYIRAIEENYKTLFSDMK